jgi:thioredoxin-like negative regulator of GroEL
VDEIARELDGKIKVVKMNVDKSRKVSEKFKVTSIPMFVYMKDGKVVGTATGAYPKDELLKMLGIEPDKM